MYARTMETYALFVFAFKRTGLFFYENVCFDLSAQRRKKDMMGENYFNLF